jgi:hypothetical protein
LAAIPGLAVLSALYFSQARDLKRLREWAGRAPERASEQAMGGRVVAQPQQVAQPAAQTAEGQKPAAAATPGAKPAVAGATPAAAAAAAAAGQTAKPAAATTAATASPAAQEAKPGALTPAAVASAAAKTPAAAAATGAGAATASGGNAGSGGTGTVTKTGPPAVGAARPGSPGAPVARRPIPRITGAQTSVLGSTTPPRDPWYRRLLARLPAPRYIALIVAGALVIGGGAAFGITQLAKDDGGGSSKGGASSSSAGDSTPSSKDTSSKDRPSTPAINPADVTVTVVNGTTIPNLARDTATQLSKLGFQIGNKVTGTGSLAAAESVVEYRPGAADEARYVAAKLHITQKQPADPDALAQAGPAQVIVVLGADQAPGG